MHGSNEVAGERRIPILNLQAEASKISQARYLVIMSTTDSMMMDSNGQPVRSGNYGTPYDFDKPPSSLPYRKPESWNPVPSHVTGNARSEMCSRPWRSPEPKRPAPSLHCLNPTRYLPAHLDSTPEPHPRNQWRRGTYMCVSTLALSRAPRRSKVTIHV